MSELLPLVASKGPGPVSIVQAIILGIVQGLTEYAPVSSSGHLILVPWVFGWTIVNDPELNKSFDVALHMGTLLGAVIYFRRDIWTYLKAFGRSVARRSIDDMEERLAWALVLGTIPGVIIGAALEGPIQDSAGQPWLIAVMLAMFGVVLWYVDIRADATRRLDTIGPRTGFGLGVAQACALQPGISRSGITMTAARWIGIDRESAARFSFLLSLPIIAGAGLYKGIDVAQSGFGGYGAQFFWGFVSSGISGFLAIWWLLRYLRRNDFALFMWYRLGVAAVVLVLIASGVRPPTI
jgi:undecaprenyl-diphosphatase